MALFQPKRNVRRRRSARPIQSYAPGLKGWLQRLPGRLKLMALSFTSPDRFREYWLTRAGAIRVLKLIGAGFAAIVLVFAAFIPFLPSPGKINSRVTAQTTKFYDRTGQTLLYSLYGNQNRTLIDFNQMPDSIKHATVAIEDRNFYHEGAFSVIGILRAAITDVLARGVRQGGSTITQQYVKNALLNPTDRSFGRKIKELILSMEIEQFYSKNDILKLYLNEIPYGSNAYGIEAACKTYFPQDNQNNSCAHNLTLGQSALLAAMANAPTYYSPYGQHTSDLLDRQHLVLSLMVQQHYITQAQADQAKWDDKELTAEVPQNQNLYANIIAPHFVLYTQEQLEAKYGTNFVDEGGLKVITTLDLPKQQLMESVAKKDIKNVRAAGGSNIAMASADPKTGQVLAMIGSYDFNDKDFGNFDVATANRQPGSSFKPFVYSTLFARNKNNPSAGSTYGPGTVLYDVPTDFGGGYKPQNDTGQNYGAVSIRTALDGSLNIPAVKALYMAGITQSITTAHNMGITTLNGDPSQYGLSLVLGAGEVKLFDMVNAYESFANGGLHYSPTTVLKVYDQKGNTLEDNTKPPTPKRVLDPQVAYSINSILSDVNARKFTYFSDTFLLTVNGYNPAAKTGTTNSFKDAWTMGYTPDLVTGVWAGNNDNTPMRALAVDIAAPIWHDFMTKALTTTYTSPSVTDHYENKAYPQDQFDRPSDMQTITLDKFTGRLPTPGSKGTETDVFPSWYKAQTAADTQSAKVDKVSGKLATDCTPPAAVETRYSSNITAEIPSSDPAYHLWEPPVAAYAASVGYGSGSGALPTASDDVHSCSDAKPTVNLSVKDNHDGSYDVSANVAAGKFPLQQLQFFFDDQIISTQQISADGSYSTTYSPTATGSHAFKAEVTDQGYYQADDSQTVNVTQVSPGGGGGSSGFQGVSPSGSRKAGSITFSWTSDGPGHTYTAVISGPTSTSCSSTSLSCTAVILAPGTYTWYAKTENGDTTTPISFKVTP